MSGIKCTECGPDMQLTKDGCITSKIFEYVYMILIKPLSESYKLKNAEAQNIESICSKIKCDYPGSYCTLENGIPKCICETINCKSNKIKVCAEDGQTYASYCDLMKSSCAKQMPIKVKYSGQCSQGIKTSYQYLKFSFI